MRKFGYWLLGIGICLVIGYGLLVIGIGGCGKLSPFFPGATTNLKSSTFAALSTQGITALGTYDATAGGWAVTPNKITGKVVSVFFTINDTEDEGIVVYGYYRPDLAQDNAALLDFELSKTKTTILSGVISKKPGYKGGPSSALLMLYGYFDVHFDHGTTQEVIRFAYGTSNPYTRGDVLLKNPTTESFEWLDNTTNALTSMRPSSPEVITFIRDFTDPNHPDMKYFPLGAEVSPSIDLPASLIENNNLTFTIDFNYLNALIFQGVTSGEAYNSLSREELVKKADMKQNTNWSSPGVNCTVTIEATPIKGGT